MTTYFSQTPMFQKNKATICIQKKLEYFQKYMKSECVLEIWENTVKRKYRHLPDILAQMTLQGGCKPEQWIIGLIDFSNTPIDLDLEKSVTKWSSLNKGWEEMCKKLDKITS